MIKMKCSKCGHKNKEKAKFCTKCGNSLAMSEEVVPSSDNSNNSRYVIIALIIIIIMLIGVIGYFTLNMQSDVGDEDSQDSADSNEVQSDDDSDSEKTTTSVSSSKTSTSSESDSKEWVSIGSYSGSGTGSETIKVPEGKIKVELSAFPIKNYATNHLYVSGPDDISGGVDWGSTSAVETRSDSFTCDLDSEEEFTIDYYETVSWEVEFYRYQ